MRIFFVLVLLSAGAAAAEESNRVLLDATYLGAPTDWCPIDAGVPLVVKMDGPDIVEGPKAWPRKVKVNRGGNLQIVHTGENTASFNRPEDFNIENAEVIGRFSAEFRTCHSAWSNPRLTGSWRLTAPSGEALGTGAFEDEIVYRFDLPFFRPVAGLSGVHYATFADKQFFAAAGPEITIKQTFAAKPDKE